MARWRPLRRKRGPNSLRSAAARAGRAVAAAVLSNRAANHAEADDRTVKSGRTGMKFGIGQPIRRKEDDRFLRGAGRYVDDISLPGQAHAALLRSPVAHGRVTTLDLSAAREAPGVLLAWSWEDVSGRLAPLANQFPLKQIDGSDPAPVLMPHLADGAVRFVGQPRRLHRRRDAGPGARRGGADRARRRRAARGRGRAGRPRTRCAAPA